MAPPLIILLVIVAIALAAGVLLFTGVGSKLKKDEEHGDLPTQQPSGGRPEHLAVTADPDDTPEPRPAAPSR